MSPELQEVISQRREALKVLCRAAQLEDDLAERWIADELNVDKYSAWMAQKNRVVSALGDWQRVTDAFLSALEGRL